MEKWEKDQNSKGRGVLENQVRAWRKVLRLHPTAKGGYHSPFPQVKDAGQVEVTATED
jgi:hypothetical protein